MKKVVFKSQLVKDGHFYCPKEYANPKAQFKVIVSQPDEEVIDSPRSFGLCKGETRLTPFYLFFPFSLIERIK